LNRQLLSWWRISESQNQHSSLADPGVWVRTAVRPDSGDEYTEFILVYIDDVLVLSHQATWILKTFEKQYEYKLKNVGPPKRYLGARISKYNIEGTQTWAISAQDYLEKAIPVVEQNHGTLKGNNKINTPLPTNYHPELDQSPFLRDNKIEIYQSYIGILRWALKLGRIDLTFSVSLMSRITTCPQEEYTSNILHMFAYVKRHTMSQLVFDVKKRD
jgi:hypothetical protein